MQRKLLILSCLCCTLFFFIPGNRPAAARTAGSGDTTVVNYKAPGAPMPHIRLVAPHPAEASSGKKQDKAGGSRIVTDKELDNNANLLVMMFNPTCGHCEEQTELFTKSVFLFKKSRLVLMAGPMMLPYLEQFNSDHHISSYPATMVMGVDSSGFIEKTFLYETLPQINIYDHGRKLVRSFTGLVAMDSLKAYIE